MYMQSKKERPPIRDNHLNQRDVLGVFTVRYFGSKERRRSRTSMAKRSPQGKRSWRLRTCHVSAGATQELSFFHLNENEALCTQQESRGHAERKEGHTGPYFLSLRYFYFASKFPYFQNSIFRRFRFPNFQPCIFFPLVANRGSTVHGLQVAKLETWKRNSC